jgi:hypothetical protein
MLTASLNVPDAFLALRPLKSTVVNTGLQNEMYRPTTDVKRSVDA